MKRSTYGERDYAFGQRMLTLRTSIGLTQVGLARLLGISRQALGEWESGSSYPKAEHLKYVIALVVQQQAFTAGLEEEEIRALWRAAHQKVLLDEPWLHELLSQQTSPRVPAPVEQTPGDDRVSVPQASGEPRVDWGEALDVPSFYGRGEELALLSRWVVEERCRVVSVLGMGGIGKSALAVTVMHRVAAQFEVVIWRSLRDAPGCSALVEECLQVLAPQRLKDKPDSLEERLRLLLEQLRERRVLLVLDNLEMLLEEGEGTGRMRAGYEGYVQLLRRMGETAYQSCLLLTSAGIGQTIRLWDVTEGRLQAVLHGHSAVIYSLAFTPDSRTLLSGSNDGTVRVWDLERGQSLRVMGATPPSSTISTGVRMARSWPVAGRIRW